MNDAIIIDSLTKRYGKHYAVHNVSLTIREKELFGLLGVNGAGKTTLIKMLSGLIIPSSGEAFLLGNSIQKNQKN